MSRRAIAMVTCFQGIFNPYKNCRFGCMYTTKTIKTEKNYIFLGESAVLSERNIQRHDSSCPETPIWEITNLSGRVTRISET
jgi:hypothetical protein